MYIELVFLSLENDLQLIYHPSKTTFLYKDKTECTGKSQTGKIIRNIN